jgi:hypothetical protein
VNTLADLGERGPLDGLATIGGVIGLIFALWQIGSWLFNKRTIIFQRVRTRQRRKILSDIKDYKRAISLKRAERSDLYIASLEMWAAARTLGMMILGLCVDLFNIMFYVSSTGSKDLSLYSVVLVTFALFYLAVQFTRSIDRAYDSLKYANAPQYSKRQLVERARKFRRRQR